MTRFIIFVLIAIILLSCGNRHGAATRALSYEVLRGESRFEPVALHEFSRPASAMAATNMFSGRLRFGAGQPQTRAKILVDSLGLFEQDSSGLLSLPEFDYQFVQHGGDLIPLRYGPIANTHGWWEYILLPGHVWDEQSDHGFSRAALPFALKERNQDCIHNGLLTFLFDDSGEISRVALQISSQTCAYLQFELHGLIDAEYRMAGVEGRANAIEGFAKENDSRLPRKAIEQLNHDYPGADFAMFGAANEIAPASMSVFGFIIDNRHYAGGCATPRGDYPYCEQFVVPSYSTAKSIVAGVAVMRAEQRHPGFSKGRIEDLVAECATGWHGVTIEHALDMTTGHYNSPKPYEDEDSALNARFFDAEDHRSRIDFACNAIDRRAEPGQIWVYHTWDTYLAGVAIGRQWQSIYGRDSDFFDDLLIRDIWEPLQLSRLSQQTRRTYDDMRQPFVGYGLSMFTDDVAKLAVFLGASDGEINGKRVLDQRMMDAIKQRLASDPGMVAESDLLRYNNGFRTRNVTDEVGCDRPVFVTTMSGFGGINIVLMPNDTAYYYFSDAHQHRYLSAVREAHKIRSLCP